MQCATPIQGCPIIISEASHIKRYCVIESSIRSSAARFSEFSTPTTYINARAILFEWATETKSEMSGKFALVTGGTGFIGRHVVKELLEEVASRQNRELIPGRDSAISCAKSG